MDERDQLLEGVAVALAPSEQQAGDLRVVFDSPCILGRFEVAFRHVSRVNSVLRATRDSPSRMDTRWTGSLGSRRPANALAVLTAMITPAVLISACGALIFSTATRLGRVIDRVRFLSTRFLYPTSRSGCH